jgi:hypothetical protein
VVNSTILRKVVDYNVGDVFPSRGLELEEDDHECDRTMLRWNVLVLEIVESYTKTKTCTTQCVDFVNVARVRPDLVLVA